MIKKFMAGAESVYVPKCEAELPEGELRTSFKLKTFSAREAAEIQDGLYAFHEKGMNQRNGTRQFMALKIGIAGAENFEKEFEKDSSGRASDAFIDAIPPDIRTELASVLLSSNGLTAAQEKN